MDRIAQKRLIQTKADDPTVGGIMTQANDPTVGGIMTLADNPTVSDGQSCY